MKKVIVSWTGTARQLKNILALNDSVIELRKKPHLTEEDDYDWVQYKADREEYYALQAESWMSEYSN